MLGEIATEASKRESLKGFASFRDETHDEHSGMRSQEKMEGSKDSKRRDVVHYEINQLAQQKVMDNDSINTDDQNLGTAKRESVLLDSNVAS